MSSVVKGFFLFMALLANGVCAAPHASAPLATPGSEGSFDNAAALKVSQAVVGTRLGEYRFRDQLGRQVTLAGYLDRPLIISLVYTACYHTCPMTTQHLRRGVEQARDALGDEAFRVLTIGFDTPNDTPEKMAQFARQQRITLLNWDFLSTDAETMARLTRDLGFIYEASPRGFDHLLQATLVKRDGVVFAQVYGERFELPALVEPLKRLVYGGKPEAGALANMVDAVRLFCTTYDPASGEYIFDYSLFIGIAIGAMIIGGGFIFLFREFRRSRHA